MKIAGFFVCALCLALLAAHYPALGQAPMGSPSSPGVAAQPSSAPATAAPASAARPIPLVSNALAAEWSSLGEVLARLQGAAQARDVNGLAFYGASVPTDQALLQVLVRTSHVAVSPAGALVRQNFVVTIQRNPPVVLSQGSHELWLARLAEGGFVLTPRRFVTPGEAVPALVGATEDETRSLVGDNTRSTLDLVASRVGGRWIALRRQRWDGDLTDEPGPLVPVGRFLTERMAAAPRSGALNAHFILQRQGEGWVGLGAAFSPMRRISAAADQLAARWRQRLQGEDYLRAVAHRDAAAAMGGVGLWAEAADELQKAELLQPGLVGAERLRQAELDRKKDPQNLVAEQIRSVQAVGLGAEHPTYLINALAKEQRNQPSALGALRLALEYSRLADEERAAAWQAQAEKLVALGVRSQDSPWINLLYTHLVERRELSRSKPANILRSALFTVRVWPGDYGVIPLLGALEEAQHTVYGDFGIPMGNTEVLLWRNQAEFARYTTQFSTQGGSEFVAALTLTKLVSTQDGPLVLGEEINTFAGTREDEGLFGTVAHEYGHVAVRQLSRGRLVPVWFNEGIASSVEGGYEGYINRVRRAANAGALLSMRELTAWNVDGERAFLAYSQANSMLDYMVVRWGKRAVLDILRQMGRDVPADTAFKAALGLSQTQIYDRWIQEGIR